MNVATRSLKWRLKKIAEGLCYICAQPPAPGKKMCARCIAVDSTRAKGRYQIRVLLSLCTMCGVRPPVDGKRGCAECRSEFSAWWGAHSKEIRAQALAAYGGKCKCCGESQPEFLALDHVDGGGNKHRREDKRAASSLALWAKRHGYPDRLQLLCFNCNWAKARYGVCPHKRDSLSTAGAAPSTSDEATSLTVQGAAE